jgi:hypothetical protein
MEKGQKIQIKLSAVNSYGTRNNEYKEKTIDYCYYSKYDGLLDWFTFVGGKTKYRLGGFRDMYSITGPERNYEIKKDN